MEAKKIFFSYSSDDRREVEKVEEAIQTEGISVWRDQKKLYAGEKWPKALGEAIAANDAVLLFWSEHAAESEFVEMEWCTAIAFKKNIIPYLLDKTPLPPSLKAIHAIKAKRPAPVGQILSSLQKSVSEVDAPQEAEVFKALQGIRSNKPKEVLDTAKAIFSQHHLNVQGNTYQAAGDIHVTLVEKDEKKYDKKSMLEKWQTWVALALGVLGVLGWFLELPKKLENWVKPGENKQAVEQLLSGSIRNEANDPLIGVRVTLPKFGLASTTNQDGRFRFKVKAKPQTQVELMAQKDGYQTHEQYASMGNTGLSFTMRQKK